jgi:hypothetical protein
MRLAGRRSLVVAACYGLMFAVRGAGTLNTQHAPLRGARTKMLAIDHWSAEKSKKAKKGAHV